MNSESIIQSSGAQPADSPVPARASRPWRVLHTCDSIGEIADVINGELAVGMRPSAVTPEGFVIFADAFRLRADGEAAGISLLNAWNDVRHWRKVILEADPEADFDLLHAHSFAAGMAGVRNYPVTVYEIEQFIEDAASGVAARPGSGAENGSWLSRSFRVAEQFVLSRAAAVIVRTESIRQAVIRRGAAAENVFAVPKPIAEEAFEDPAADVEWLSSLAVDKWHHVALYAPDWKIETAADGKLSEASQGLLEAFAMAAAEEDGAYLLVECSAAARTAVQEFTEHLEIASRVKIIGQADRQKAFAAAQVVVTNSCPSMLSTPMANDSSRKALMMGKALLAADLPCNRDITGDGRGCLWYRAGDYKDVAHRMAFLARNADFRASLAQAGRAHLMEMCNAEAVGMAYDRIYRHAAARRKAGGLQTPAISLTPASSML